MGNLSGYNASEHEPGRDFDPIPNGKYPAQIVASEQRDIGDGGSKGWKFTLQWKVTEGAFENRVIFQDILSGYNVQGEKGDKTRNIAGSQMGDICRATGKLAPDDTADLHFIPCEIAVGLRKQNIDPKTGQPYPPQNEIKGVKPIGGGGQSASRAPASSPSARQVQPQRPATASRPASGGWNRPAA